MDYADGLALLAGGGARGRPRATSTSACPRCRWTRASAASPTPTTRRSTCGWTPARRSTPATVVNEWDERRLAQALPRATARSATRARSRARSCAAASARRIETTQRAGGRRSRRAVPAPPAQLRRRPSGQARLPGDPDRGQRRARRARPRAARWPGSCCAPAAGWPRSRSTRSRTGASSASWPTARAAASARPTFPICACGREPEAELLTRRAVVPTPGEVAAQPARAVGPPARGPQASRRGGPLLMARPHAAARRPRPAQPRPRRRARRSPGRRARPRRGPPAGAAAAGGVARRPALRRRAAVVRRAAARRPPPLSAGACGSAWSRPAGRDRLLQRRPAPAEPRDRASTAEARRPQARRTRALRAQARSSGPASASRGAPRSWAWCCPPPGEVRYLDASPTRRRASAAREPLTT